MGGARAAAVAEPGTLRVLLRGFVKRCPRCGGGKLFSRWFKLAERCPGCQLRFDRNEGAFLGSVTINYAVTMAAWVALLVGWFVATLPDIRVAPLMAASLAVVAIVPVVFYPFSKTIWAAIEFLMDGGGPDPLEQE